MEVKNKSKSCRFCGVDFLNTDALRIHESYCRCYHCQYFDLDQPGFCVYKDTTKCVIDNEKSRL